MKIIKKYTLCLLTECLIILFCSLITEAAVTPVDMVFIPSGYSMMGTEYGDLTAETNTKPYHMVFLDGFFIDANEITNADYAVCVSAEKCKEPENFDSKTRQNYYSNPIFAAFPVVNVTWQDAADYCSFVEKRLPTEAEWERAARGISDNRRFPWGNSSPKNYHMNITLIPGDTERVNIYEKGNSPYGVSDMIGNVSEWTSDWYDENWYDHKEQNNPKGPEFGTEKAVRGNSFETEQKDLHLASRQGLSPESYSYAVGFRCALSIRESVGYDFSSNELQEYEPEFAYVKAGNENGIFLLAEPGSGYGTAMIAVIPNGAVVEILAGPVNINYSDWYQVRTQNGETGWTLSSAVVSVDDPK